MTYVGAPQWKYDFFLSYARMDNRAEFGSSPWVMRFRDKIRAEIQRTIGEDVANFFDEISEENLGADSFATIASQSAVLIPVITPTYLKRPYCRIEWDAFRQAHGGTANIVAVQPFPIRDDAVRFPGMEKVFPTQFFDSLDERPESFSLQSTAFRKKFRVFFDRLKARLEALKSAHGGVGGPVP